MGAQNTEILKGSRFACTHHPRTSSQ